ncbi:MAG: type II secretion system F family protein, partial [Proteobacteria bacterium]|nr:type II secretion system F family protein [Pseudomonadota bacterium]
VESQDMAYQSLVDKGLIPTKVKLGGAIKKTEVGGGFMARFQQIKPQDLILFTKQLKTMLNAGVPVLQTLKVLEEQTENPRLKAAVVDIINDVTTGSTLFRAFSRHKSIFSRLYCNMVRAGEVSGTLLEVLERLIYIVEHENKVIKDIKSALTYPIVVVVALVIAFIVLITVVLPNFIDLFEGQGIELPMPTRICIEIHHVFMAYWPLILVGTFAAGFGLVTWVKTERGCLMKDRFLLALPILGDVFVKAAMSRFGSIFAILQASGVTVLESVDIISGTIGNSAVSKEFEGVREKLEQGRGLAGPLKQARYFTPMLVSMVAIGEESGQLEEMLKEISVHYDYEVDYSVSKMSELLGPMLVACLAGVVGFFGLAIMLPMIDLMTNAMSGM